MANESFNPLIAKVGRGQLQIALLLVFLGLLFVSRKEDFQGWNLLGTAIGYIITLAILYCVYLGNKLWIWFLRAILIIFGGILLLGLAYALTGKTQPADQNPLTVKTLCYFLGLGYVLWALCFSKSIRYYWRFARKM
ncbi:MAG: hypothetical protein LBH01_08955 [Verrucomicrobiales bacterium]|jgi:hypothetical protein|nr:hypothetical protein [Verrucomicrobiales bacterium]